MRHVWRFFIFLFFFAVTSVPVLSVFPQVPLFKQPDVSRQPGRRWRHSRGQPRDWQQMKWQARRWRATGKVRDGCRGGGGLTVCGPWELPHLAGWLCQMLFSHFVSLRQASRNVSLSGTLDGKSEIGTVHPVISVCSGLVTFFFFCLIHIPYIWFSSLPGEGSTSLPNVILTPATHSIPVLHALLCNLWRRGMQTEVII